MIKRYSRPLFIAVSVALAFFIGRAGYYQGQLEDVTTALHGTQAQLRSLEKTVATSLHISMQSPDIEVILKKAEEALKQGQLVNAGMYYSNAVHTAQGSWAVLERYQRSMLSYCTHMSTQNQAETALHILSEVEGFLRAQAIYLPGTELEPLQAALLEVEQARQSIAQQRDRQAVENAQQMASKLMDEAHALLKHNPKEVMQRLKTTLDAFLALDTSRLPAQQMESLQNTLQELEQTVSDRELGGKAAVSAITALEQRIEQMIDQASREPARSDFVLYYLTSAEALIQQMAIMSPDAMDIKQRMSQFSIRLDQTKAAIATQRSETVWGNMDQEITKFQTADFTKSKLQEGIDQGNTLRELILSRMTKLSAPQSLEHAQEALKGLNDRILALQKQQAEAYERWAIQTVQKFYGDAQQALGTLSNDKEAITNSILTSLGDIDMRYLSLPVSAAYTEAFTFFYGKLKDEQKLKLSAQMALRKKKPLSDF